MARMDVGTYLVVAGTLDCSFSSRWDDYETGMNTVWSVVGILEYGNEYGDDVGDVCTRIVVFRGGDGDLASLGVHLSLWLILNLKLKSLSLCNTVDVDDTTGTKWVGVNSLFGFGGNVLVHMILVAVSPTGWIHWWRLS